MPWLEDEPESLKVGEMERSVYMAGVLMVIKRQAFGTG